MGLFPVTVSFRPLRVGFCLYDVREPPFSTWPVRLFFDAHSRFGRGAAGHQLQPRRQMEGAHQQVHRPHSGQRRRTMRGRAEHIRRGATENTGQKRHDGEGRCGREAQDVNHGHTRRGGATTRRSRCAPWERDRATGRRPRGHPRRANRRSFPVSYKSLASAQIVGMAGLQARPLDDGTFALAVGVLVFRPLRPAHR